MATERYPSREPEFEGGSQPVPERPPDEPGKARGPAFGIVAVLAILVAAMPVAWGLGALATVGASLGQAVVTILWIVWALLLVALVWTLWVMWRRAA